MLFVPGAVIAAAAVVEVAFFADAGSQEVQGWQSEEGTSPPPSPPSSSPVALSACHTLLSFSECLHQALPPPPPPPS